MIMKEKTACFTGHRDIPQSELKQISKALKKAICEAYENGYRIFASGGAVGFDLLAAETVLSLKRKYRDIKLILVIPCPEQTKYWSEKEIKRYEKIKLKADKTVCVSDHYFNGCMQKRNRFLADISSLCKLSLKVANLLLLFEKTVNKKKPFIPFLLGFNALGNSL